MSQVSNPSKHAPWRKRVLIPLWAFQLALTAFPFGWTLLKFSQELYFGARGHGWYDNSMGFYIAAPLIVSILNFILLIVIITSIVRFSIFALTTLVFQREASIAIALGSLSIIFSFAGFDYFGGLFVAAQLLFSIGLLIYAVVIRRRVLKVVLGEMSKGARDTPEDGPYIELVENKKKNFTVIDGNVAGIS